MTRRQLMMGAAVLALPGAATAAGPPATPAPSPAMARLEAARRGLDQFDGHPADGANCTLAREWARRVAQSELALCGRPTERLAALEGYARRARDAERLARAAHKAGAGTLAEVLEAEFYRADADALLAEEKAHQADRK